MDRPRCSPGRLVVAFRGEVVMELPLEGSALGIGSSEDNELRLAGTGVRDHHLVLRRRGRRWIALARGEACIAGPSGKPVRQERLVPGTRIAFGDFTIEMTSTADPRASTATLLESHARRSCPAMELRTQDDRLLLGRSGATIGRDPSCDLVADDPYMSLVHARVMPAPGGWVVTDMGSRNGTRLDGRLVDGAELCPGSRLVLGRTLVECVEPDPDPSGSWVKTPGLGSSIDEIDRCAATALPVLLVGESGVGKEGLARRLHERGSRSRGPFVPVNCGALPESLADSILFGHVRGAFTGANEPRQGLVQASSSGTLFLDEVGELSPASQARLLRVVEESAVRPLGSARTEPVDLRIVSATHRDLPSRVREETFRLDLLHRLAVLTVEVPPLRRRASDIDVLVRHLLERGDVPAAGILPEALEILRQHSWPGNVRELRNVLSRASMLAAGGVILPAHVVFMDPGSEPLPRRVLPSTEAEARTLLARSSGNITRAARTLGVARSTLRDRLKRLGILPTARSCQPPAHPSRA
jgi:pSer/pThr/pTyr-binding forkhead associated (FHA) protein/MoxR-like ATPase